MLINYLCGARLKTISEEKPIKNVTYTYALECIYMALCPTVTQRQNNNMLFLKIFENLS